MRIRWARFLFGILAAALLGLRPIAVAASPAEPRHVVIVVWDGMRPDFVSEENTPTLWKLAQSGVTFQNHHSVYPSATIVNGTAINTGVYPNHSGILANHDYLPAINAKKSIDVENVAVVRKGDELSGGKYLGVPTIAELIQKNGGRSVIATDKTVGLLFDRRREARAGRDIFAGEPLPPDEIDSIVKTFGRFPPANEPQNRDAWTTAALAGPLWKDGVPEFSLLWLSEPDDTEHHTAPGAREARLAILSSDKQLAMLLVFLSQN